MTVAGSRRLDVVIVNYETPDLLGACLRSIAAVDAACIGDIIVVDNSRTPEPAQRVVRDHAGVRLIRSAGNVGYGRAANTGVAAATSQYALVLNADSQLRDGAADALVRELDLHPEAAIIGPRLVDDAGRVQPSCARFPAAGRLFLNETGLWKIGLFKPIATTLGRRVLPFFDPDEPTVVPWVLGAALAVRRRSFDDVGGFDPAYFMYYEEVDLSRRLAATGAVTRFTPAATISHVGGASTSQNHAPMQREMFRSLAVYMRRHARDPGLARLRVAVLAIAFAWLARDVLVPGNRGDRKESLDAWRRVTGDALRGWRDV
ncbi:MAG TPA: glycosyltransferase family 2 protein [Ilumatobacteraceae bacterium]